MSLKAGLNSLHSPSSENVCILLEGSFFAALTVLSALIVPLLLASIVSTEKSAVSLFKKCIFITVVSHCSQDTFHCLNIWQIDCDAPWMDFF